jgi:glycosyltransferase involved in cell wall biosynthesis
LLENEELRKLWRNWALEYVKQFDYSQIIDQYEEVYETAHKKHKKILDMSEA